MGIDTAHVEPARRHRLDGAVQSSRPRPLAKASLRLLEPTPGGLAERFAAAVGEGHPVRVFLVAAVGGYLLLVGLMVALGLLLTKVLLDIGGLSAWDEHLSRWLAQHRTPFLVDLSWLGSTFAGGVVIPIFVGGLLLIFCLHRRWRLAAFTLFVICIESGGYRATSLIVHRDRPDVHRLESLPVNESYPSGHTAASLALYGGLLLVLSSRIESLRLKLLLWALAVAIPLFVGWSRMERGMHHLTDTIAGVILGIAALTVTIFAARAAGRRASETRQRDDQRRGDRPRRQVDRRRARRAALDPGARRGERAALVGGAEEQVRARARRAGAGGRRRARLRLGRRRDGAALGRRARGQRRHARDHPGRHGEPLRIEPRDPLGDRGGGRHRAQRAATGCSTSARSTASGSRSWPARASTRA